MSANGESQQLNDQNGCADDNTGKLGYSSEITQQEKPIVDGEDLLKRYKQLLADPDPFDGSNPVVSANKKSNNVKNNEALLEGEENNNEGDFKKHKNSEENDYPSQSHVSGDVLNMSKHCNCNDYFQSKITLQLQSSEEAVDQQEKRNFKIIEEKTTKEIDNVMEQFDCHPHKDTVQQYLQKIKMLSKVRSMEDNTDVSINCPDKDVNRTEYHLQISSDKQLDDLEVCKTEGHLEPISACDTENVTGNTIDQVSYDLNKKSSQHLDLDIKSSPGTEKMLEKNEGQEVDALHDSQTGHSEITPETNVDVSLNIAVTAKAADENEELPTNVRAEESAESRSDEVNGLLYKYQSTYDRRKNSLPDTSKIVADNRKTLKEIEEVIKKFKQHTDTGDAEIKNKLIASDAKDLPEQDSNLQCEKNDQRKESVATQAQRGKTPQEARAQRYTATQDIVLQKALTNTDCSKAATLQAESSSVSTTSSSCGFQTKWSNDRCSQLSWRRRRHTKYSELDSTVESVATDEQIIVKQKGDLRIRSEESIRILPVDKVATKVEADAVWKDGTLHIILKTCLDSMPLLKRSIDLTSKSSCTSSRPMNLRLDYAKSNFSKAKSSEKLDRNVVENRAAVGRQFDTSITKTTERIPLREIYKHKISTSRR